MDKNAVLLFHSGDFQSCENLVNRYEIKNFLESKNFNKLFMKVLKRDKKMYIFTSNIDLFLTSYKMKYPNIKIEQINKKRGFCNILYIKKEISQ
jgi:hypothetical protein